MPYGGQTLGDYTKLIVGTHSFSYGKVVAIAVLIDGAVDFDSDAVWDGYGTTPANLPADAKVIKNIIGEYDGGQPVTDIGYGAKLENVTEIVHTINFRMEYNSVNRSFVENLMLSDNVGVAFMTGNYEELNVVKGIEVSFTAQMPVNTEINKPREYTAVAKWSEIAFPSTITLTDDIKNLFKP